MSLKTPIDSYEKISGYTIIKIILPDLLASLGAIWTSFQRLLLIIFIYFWTRYSALAACRCFYLWLHPTFIYKVVGIFKGWHRLSTDLLDATSKVKVYNFECRIMFASPKVRCDATSFDVLYEPTGNELVMNVFPWIELEYYKTNIQLWSAVRKRCLASCMYISMIPRKGRMCSEWQVLFLELWMCTSYDI